VSAKSERALRPRDRAACATTSPAARNAAPPTERLAGYLDLLAKWNRVYNLTAIRERRQMETHHVEDALAVLPYLPDARGLRVLDVGSGGGIPGIPLAIARPDWHVTLLDANRKKATFLAQAVIELRLTNARAVESRAETFRADAPYDVVISRAFSDLRTFVEAAEAHVKERGMLVAMKGALPHDEIRALPAHVIVAATPRLDVPGLAAERHLVVMRLEQGRAS
jgi:16S rRNA (guanine527-N7)-methyltransferase